MGGVRLVPGVEQDPHDLTYRRDVPEPGVDVRLGGRPGQNSLEVFLLGAGGFRRVLVPGVPGQDRAHPGGPPVGRPFLHGPLSALDRLCDDAHVDATGGVQDRLGLHPHQHMIVGTPPPPDQDGGLLRGDPDPHAPTASETAQETHETRFRFMPAIVLNNPHGTCGFITCKRQEMIARGSFKTSFE